MRAVPRQACRSRHNGVGRREGGHEEEESIAAAYRYQAGRPRPAAVSALAERGLYNFEIAIYFLN